MLVAGCLTGPAHYRQHTAAGCRAQPEVRLYGTVFSFIFMFSSRHGPLLQTLPRLLELLAQHNAYGTFFLDAASVQQKGDLVDTLLLAGHEVGCLGLAGAHWSTEIAADIALTRDALQKRVEACLDVLTQRASRIGGGGLADLRGIGSNGVDGVNGSAGADGIGSRPTVDIASGDSASHSYASNGSSSGVQHPPPASRRGRLRSASPRPIRGKTESGSRSPHHRPIDGAASVTNGPLSGSDPVTFSAHGLLPAVAGFARPGDGVMRGSRSAVALPALGAHDSILPPVLGSGPGSGSGGLKASRQASGGAGQRSHDTMDAPGAPAPGEHGPSTASYRQHPLPDGSGGPLACAPASQALHSIQHRVAWFRPQDASRDLTVLRAANMSGLRVAFWTATPYDWCVRRGQVSERLRDQLGGPRAAPGAILQLHVSLPDWLQAPKAAQWPAHDVLGTTAEVLQLLQEWGLSGVSLSSLLGSHVAADRHRFSID